MSASDLERLALACDIQLSYQDLQKNSICARPESLLAALKAMGEIEAPADVPDALKQHRLAAWDWSLPPVVVVWGDHGAGGPARVAVRLPEQALGVANLRIVLEDGGVIEHARRLDRARVVTSRSIGRRRYVEVGLTLPSGLPFGYHRLCLEVAGRQMGSWLICAPRKAFAPPHAPGWGVFMPLYALHSDRSWGIGDYSDLKRLIEWAGSKGADVVATLPLLPAFLETPFEPSPYQPVSRLFWNEVFVDPEAPLPGGETFWVDPDLARQARGLTAGTDVDYAAVMRIKRRALESHAGSLELHTASANAFDDYLAARPEVHTYASFRAAMERLGPDWREWPEGQREGNLGRDDYNPETARYYEYAQWRAYSQMQDACESADARGMRSYLDMPVGVHQQGYDAWRYQDVFAPGMSVGAPPDLLATNGQNWGFQPLVPRKLREAGYEYVVRYLRHYFESAKMLRIDHAIGLHRLYWIPEGSTGRDGVFVRQPAEELYAVLCLESMRNQAVVVAEDLGLVPPEVRRGLKAHGIGGMYVQMFEMTGKRRQPQRKPSEGAIGSFSTHDLPTFAAYWQDDDLKQRQTLGLLTPERVTEEIDQRKRHRRALVANLSDRGLVRDASDTGQVYRGSTALLAESNAAWVLLDIEDAWGETRAQNLPGTTSDQHPNWVARARYGLDEFESVEGLTKAVNTVKLYRSHEPKVTPELSAAGARAR